jgi:prophage antirepressor-like protein
MGDFGYNMSMGNLRKLDRQDFFGMSIIAYGTRRRPLFLLEDVAEWLGHSDVLVMLENVNDDEKIRTILPSDQCLAGLQPNTEYEFLTEFVFY